MQPAGGLAVRREEKRVAECCKRALRSSPRGIKGRQRCAISRSAPERRSDRSTGGVAEGCVAAGSLKMGDHCSFCAERGRCEHMLIFLLTKTRDSSHLCYDGNDARQRRLPKWISFIELIRASLKREEVNIMDRFESVKNPINIAPSLPNRRGKRPLTIVSPLHVQCSDHGDDRALRDLVNEVIAWPDIEAGPLPVGSADLVSFQVGEDVATGAPSVFIAGREFGRVLFGAPTIYLTLPLICAHWAVVRGWAEPHYSSGTGLVPPGVMVVYTPRDGDEVAVCRSLFWISYNFSLNERSKKSAEWNAALKYERKSPREPCTLKRDR